MQGLDSKRFGSGLRGSARMVSIFNQYSWMGQMEKDIEVLRLTASVVAVEDSRHPSGMKPAPHPLGYHG